MQTDEDAAGRDDRVSGILFVGGGNMATALIGGIVARGHPANAIAVAEPAAAQREALAARFEGIRCIGDAGEAPLAGVSLVVLAVKPQQARAACTAIAASIHAVPALLSIAAGVRCAELSRWLGGYTRIVRAMPNTPALVGAGVTGVYATPDVPTAGLDAATALLRAAGEVVTCAREAALDAVTGVSGSGPAYVFYFLEALTEAAMELGFGEADARKLAYTTFEGAIKLAQASSAEPATLRAQVTSKGGTTERAISMLERADVKRHFIDAVKAAAARARELGDAAGRE
jgi:pyrroline-5-carboxylate reductase